ncbi:MAG TPA: class I SAM-dependent methyltransferase [Gemmatimonadaceae bacterium]|nr:class I SAM-dependent methyltransferase [Gemmatimonadaceae bacterium]
MTDAYSSTVDMSPAQQYQTLRRQLGRRFHIVAVSVAIGDTDVVIERPRSAEELIRPEDFEHDERLPYWAELWPSALVLASSLPHSSGRLLELGCGVGLVSAVALIKGWNVVATDYYEDALKFTQLNALAIARKKPETRLVDWRDMPDLGRFDAVVAADVLYEKPYPALIASAIARTLAPGGTAIIVDPNRVHAPAFTPACEAERLAVSAKKAGSMTTYRVSRSRSSRRSPA